MLGPKIELEQRKGAAGAANLKSICLPLVYCVLLKSGCMLSRAAHTRCKQPPKQKLIAHQHKIPHELARKFN